MYLSRTITNFYPVIITITITKIHDCYKSMQKKSKQYDHIISNQNDDDDDDDYLVDIDIDSENNE